MNAFQPFKQLVYDYSGLTLDSSVAEQRLQQLLEQGMQQLGLDSHSYLLYLRQHSAVLHSLVSQLTVNETYFFRDPEQIRFCVTQLLPRLLQQAHNRPLRILSAGCSSGEEPYSLVMAILDQHGEAVLERIQFEGGDLDLDILERARSARYSPFSFRGVDEHIRQRFFTAETNGYRLLPEIARRVRFSVLNLKDSVYPANNGPYDLILFRNVSIYFDRETRQAIQQKFSRIMQPDALLLPGSSETLANDFDVFRLCEEQGQYYFVQGERLLPAGQRHPALPGAPLTPRPPRPRRQLTSAPRPPTASTPVSLPEPALPEPDSIRQLLGEERYADAARLLQNHPEQGPDSAAINLMRAWVSLNTRNFQHAEQLLQRCLQDDPWHLESLLTLGLLHRWQGEQEQACATMKIAAYAHADSWLAQYFYGDCLRQTGALHQARVPLGIAARILEQSPEAATGCHWLPLAPAAADALFLIRRHLQQLDQIPVAGH